MERALASEMTLGTRVKSFLTQPHLIAQQAASAKAAQRRLGCAYLVGQRGKIEVPQADEFVKASGQQQALGLQLQVVRVRMTELPRRDGRQDRLGLRLYVYGKR